MQLDSLRQTGTGFSLGKASILLSALIGAYTFGKRERKAVLTTSAGGCVMDHDTECQHARNELFNLCGGDRKAREAVVHVAGCRAGVCAGIWNGWTQFLASAARLRTACVPAAALLDGSPHSDCAWARMAFRQPAADELVRAATVHVVSCADGECLFLKQALVQYLGALRTLNSPGQLALPEEVREALTRGKYLAPPRWPMAGQVALLSDLRGGSG